MKKSLIILSALSVVPLCGAQNLEVVPMPADTAAAVGLAQQEAYIRSSLALLPKDTEAFAAFGNLPAALELADMPKEALGPIAEIESIAVGLGAGSAEMLRQATPLYTVLSTDDAMEDMATNWAQVAHGYATDVIGKQWKQHRQESLDQAIAALAGLRVAPMYGVVTVTENGRPLLEEMQQSLLKELQENGAVTMVEIGSWKGARLSLAEDDIEGILSDVDAENPTALQKVQLGDALRKLSLYLLCQVQERSLVFALCTDPAEIHPAAGPADSVLSTPQADLLKRQPNPLMAAHLPAELINACRGLQNSPLRCFSGFATSVFKTLGANAQAGSPELYQQAVESIVTLNGALESREVSKPTTVLLWSDRALHLEIVSDACGVRFVPSAKPALPAAVTHPIFTLDCDAVQGSCTWDGAALMTACERLTDGLVATLNAEAQDEAKAALTQYHFFDSEKAMLGSALAAWREAFSGRVSLVVDGGATVPASLFGGSPVDSLPVPRVAVTAGVDNRNRISDGYALIMKAAEQGLGKVGEDAAVLQGLPLSESQSGKATLHMLALPVCCPGFSPTVAVTNETWSLSSSAELAAACADSELKPAPAEAKAAFCFTPAPMAEMLRGMASSVLPESMKPDVREAADAAEALSSVISSVSGSVTTPGDDCLHLQVDVSLNKH